MGKEELGFMLETPDQAPEVLGITERRTEDCDCANEPSNGEGQGMELPQARVLKGFNDSRE